MPGAHFHHRPIFWAIKPSALAARMMLRVQRLQVFTGDMGVNPRRRDVDVGEQPLDDAQVGAIIP
jgi:hypothetical protein